MDCGEPLSSPSPESVEKEANRHFEERVAKDVLKSIGVAFGCDVTSNYSVRLILAAFLKVRLASGKKDAVSATTVQGQIKFQEDSKRLDWLEHALWNHPDTGNGIAILPAFFHATGKRSVSLHALGDEDGSNLGDELTASQSSLRAAIDAARSERSLSSPKATESADVTTDLGEKETSETNPHVLQMALDELRNIVNADMKAIREDFGDDANLQFRLWAQNRARAVIEKASSASGKQNSASLSEPC